MEWIVIAGLDPAIHSAAARWMPGSRLGMTIWKVDELNVR
jgi:hypothetical protein